MPILSRILETLEKSQVKQQQPKKFEIPPSLLTSRTQSVNISNKRLVNSSIGSLYAGSQFKGIQKCGISKYNVSVDIQASKI